MLAAGLCLLGAKSAHASWLGDLMGTSEVAFCPLVYGPACRTSLAVDLSILYQQSRLPDFTVEEYLRLGGEVAVLQRIGNTSFHVGAGLVAGRQEGDGITAFHITPRVRFRAFPSRGPVSIELASGPLFERSWSDTGPGCYGVGISNELSVGVLGFVSLVGGMEVLWDPLGARGEVVQFVVGGRLSIVSLFLIAAAKGR